MQCAGLKGKRVLVTGGAQGIGYATAMRFLQEGARVAILDKRFGTPAEYTGCVTIEGDVSDEASVVQAFEKLDRAWSGLDILVANAGISLRRAFLDISWEDWQKVIGTNLNGVFLTCREAVRRMGAQGAGILITLGSTNGLQAHPYYSDYNASKAGVIMLTRTLAREYGPWLRAVAICPGYVLTPMQKSEYSEDMLAAVNEKLPLKRHAQPEEVADLIAFLCSDRARYISGVPLIIDGGETA